MKVYLQHDKELQYPVAFREDTHVPDVYLLRYAICKHQYPSLVENRKVRKCAMKTIVDALQRVCYLINRLAEQEQTDGTVGIHYLAATYNENMKPLIHAMYHEGGWKGESIEQYVKAWRQFYRFLTNQGIEHEMFMPETNEVTRLQDQDDNFLSHTNYCKEFNGEQETAVNQNWKERHDDDYDSILTMDQFWRLYKEMHEVDPVFAVMAYTELTTCLRVTGLIDHFPLGPNKANPKWKSYKVMKRDKAASQNLRYIAKGGKTKSLLVPASLMEVFHKVYEKPEEGITYQQRLKRYLDGYCKTKHAINSGRSSNDDPTWLQENGTPVSVRKYQKVMEDCAKKSGFHAHPHMLRHTGATQMLYRWIDYHDLFTGFNHTNEHLIADAHIILQRHLGHVSVETTKRYIRTIERFISESNINMLLNTALSTSKEHHELLNRNPVLARGMEILEEAINGSGLIEDLKTI